MSVVRHAWESRVVGHHTAVYDGDTVKHGAKHYAITKYVCRRCGAVEEHAPRPWWATAPSEGTLTVRDCA